MFFFFFVARMLKNSFKKRQKMQTAQKINKKLEHFLKGNFVNLREVKLDDAEFIVKLRNSSHGAMLNSGAKNVNEQEKWLLDYFLRNEYYFIIEKTLTKEPLGCVRIYGIHGTSFETSSWIMKENCDLKESLEGILLAWNFAFLGLGMQKDCYFVRKNNPKVITFHRNFNAKQTNENETTFYFERTKDDFLIAKHKIEQILKS